MGLYRSICASARHRNMLLVRRGREKWVNRESSWVLHAIIALLSPWPGSGRLEVGVVVVDGQETRHVPSMYANALCWQVQGPPGSPETLMQCFRLHRNLTDKKLNLQHIYAVYAYLSDSQGSMQSWSKASRRSKRMLWVPLLGFWSWKEQLPVVQTLRSMIEVSGQDGRSVSKAVWKIVCMGKYCTYVGYKLREIMRNAVCLWLKKTHKVCHGKFWEQRSFPSRQTSRWIMIHCSHQEQCWALMRQLIRSPHSSDLEESDPSESSNYLFKFHICASW